MNKTTQTIRATGNNSNSNFDVEITDWKKENIIEEEVIEKKV